MEIFVNNIKKIVLVVLLLFVFYLLGTTQAETIIEVKTIEKIRTVIPDNYICVDNIMYVESNDYGIQIYFTDGTGYYWSKER